MLKQSYMVELYPIDDIPRVFVRKKCLTLSLMLRLFTYRKELILLPIHNYRHKRSENDCGMKGNIDSHSKIKSEIFGCKI